MPPIVFRSARTGSIHLWAPETLPEITAGDLRWRPATIDDAPLVTVLTNTMAEADGAPYRETEDETREELGAAWRERVTTSEPRGAVSARPVELRSEDSTSREPVLA